jgi:hypothetical protein
MMKVCPNLKQENLFRQLRLLLVLDLQDCPV